jgi:hypothetical protein
MLLPDERIASNRVEITIVFGAKRSELDERAVQRRLTAKRHPTFLLPVRTIVCPPAVSCGRS